jgi:hypothetical protein
MSRGAHLFVAVIFTLLGLSFLASTGLLIQEFREADWGSIVIAHSHLFIFFPTLGILALAAFYLPSVIFTEHYWSGEVPYGKLRFAIGFVVVAGLAYYASTLLSGQSLRAIWEVAPAELRRELAAGPAQTRLRCIDPVKVDAQRGARARGEAAAVSDVTRPCPPRLPVLKALQELRREAQQRSSLSEFARSCRPDPLMELPEAHAADRHCFPVGQKLNAADCCRVQADFSAHVRELYIGSQTRSKAAQLEPALLVLKNFFVLVLFVIGGLLLVWRKALKARYARHLPAMERGIVVGAIAMLFWVLMDYGYQQATDVLFGREQEGISPRLSLIFVPWAVLLIFYFMERLGRDLERVAQIATIVGSGYTLLRYQQINDLTARVLGVGAEWWHFVLLGIIGLALLAILLQPLWRRAPEPAQRRPTAEPMT